MVSVFKEPKNIIRLGYVFIILAGLWRWFVLRDHLLAEGPADFGAGLLNGVAIGALGLGIWKQGRQNMARPGRS